jgi:uncharacterized protein YxjI
MPHATPSIPDSCQKTDNLEKSPGRHYILRQKMVSIGSDYWVENERGQKVYFISGKIGLHKNFIFEDIKGNRLIKIHKALLTEQETMEIEGTDGGNLAVVKKDRFTPLREHFVVNMKNGPGMEIHGNIIDHKYTIRKGQDVVAQVSKKFFHLHDSYNIKIEPGQEDILIVAFVVCIDEMTHSGK